MTRPHHPLAGDGGPRVRQSFVERIGPGDLTQLATDVGPVAMNVGAVLVLEQGSPGVAPAGTRRELADRIGRIPRMRQRLATLPWGLGRPVWVDAEDFDPAAHISTVACPEPGDRAALLDLAVAEVTRALPRDRPLWRALVVAELEGQRVALVVVMHHVLADGIGGLAVLASLADTSWAPTSPTPAARPRPTYRQLAAENAAARGRALRSAPHVLGQLRHARAELGATSSVTAPRCSLNAPTGPRRRVTSVEVDLAAVQGAARRHAGTVNDLLLVAVAAAMDTVLASRGEHVPALVVSVPISARTEATTRDLGNQVGVMPVAVPLTGALSERLAHVARTTAGQKGTTRGSSAALVGPAFRALAALGVFGWFIDRQHLVNTFLTNLRGPAQPVTFHGSTIESITPITVTAGNVTTAFAALSYAGTLTISIITDPDHVPNQHQLANALSHHLHALTR